MDGAKTVEFYYDLVSPYSYLAQTQLFDLCERRGAEVALRPVLLGAVHKATGNQAPIATEAKAAYQRRDIERWAEHYGVPVSLPDPFPFRTLKTMRAAMFLAQRDGLRAFTREGFGLYWRDGGAPRGFAEEDEDGPVAQISRRIGADPDEVLAGAGSGPAKAALREATEEAVQRGVFGTPAFFVGEEMFFGNDRLQFVEAALEA